MYKTYEAPNIIFVVLLLGGLSMLSLILARPQGPHGGIIKKSGNYLIEMKVSENILSTYFITKKSKPVSVTAVSGEVKFSFADNADLIVPLKAITETRFICETPSGFSECVITFNYLGKAISAKFSNTVQPASKNRFDRYSQQAISL